ncbi:MAG: hypothetical protein NC417_11860 [Candidatus Gastranaerophilales bacterium]|nr:hypothetical protein [Candidatus Gastranaerophilales bacterium]
MEENLTGERKKAAYRMLFLIATPKLVKKAIELAKENDLPIQYLFHAQGTASSEVMDMLGLDGVDKNVLMSMLPKYYADMMIKKLHKKLHLGMPNTGIAFTVTMSSGSGRILQMMEGMQAEGEQNLSEREGAKMVGIEYYMILAIVNQGFSEEVMDAARPMGASGGTVFHSRRIGSENAMKFWKISVQQEREVVIILAQKDDRQSIMQAIGQKCGMQSKAQGIVLSLPVDGIAGLD